MSQDARDLMSKQVSHQCKKRLEKKKKKRLLLIYTCGGKWWMKSQLG